MNISNAPDGTLYIADMYHGIIQERQWTGPGTYLRAKIEQYQLDKVAQRTAASGGCATTAAPAVPATATNPGQPAIPAIAPDFTPPRMYSETPAQLVAHLAHPNGWWRDTAQRLLVLKQDKSVVPALQQMARSARDNLARRAFHALWTLEGLGALDAALVREAMKDANPRMRVQAIRASETLYKAGDKSLADDYRALAKDADPTSSIQAMLTLNLFKVPDAADVIKAAQAANKAQGRAVDRRAAARRRPPAVGGGRGAAARSRRGAEAAGAGRATSSTPSASLPRRRRPRAAPLAGAAAGTMMAPPLAGSPRVQGHRDYVIKVLLKG